MIIVRAYSYRTGRSIDVLADTMTVAAGLRAFILGANWLRYDGTDVR